MNKTAQINSCQQNGNLHIQLGGLFSSGAAIELTSLMQRNYRGEGNIIIHTKMLTGVSPSSKIVFENLMDQSGLPLKDIYLTGPKGLEICYDVYKLMEQRKRKKEKNCKNCKNCNCSSKKEEEILQ